MLDEHVHAAAVGQHRGDVGAGLVDRVVDRGHHLAAQCHHVGAVDDGVGELVLAGAAEGQARGTAVVDAELGLQAVGRLLLAGELEHQRMHLELDALDLLGPHALGAQLRAGVDAGVDHDAAGKGLVGVEAISKRWPSSSVISASRSWSRWSASCRAAPPAHAGWR
jgi:hypothetical protein